MTSTGKPQDFVIGVVGDGFGALLTYTTAVYLGFRPAQVGIFGENPDPVTTYLGFATNLGQTVLRSESESHFLPADWPTFAQVDAYARRDPSPLFRSVGRKFNPGVPEMMAEARTVAHELGFANQLVGGTKVGWLIREPGPPPHFSMYDEEARLLGRAKHVLVAIGHGPLSFPGALGKAREDPATARTDRAGLRAQAVLQGRALHRARLRDSRRSTSGSTSSRRAPSASPCGAIPSPRSRT